MALVQVHTWMLTFQAALTPNERFQAVRQLNTSYGNGLLTNKWFVLLGWSVVILLSLLLVAVRQMRKEKEKIAREQRFNEQANALELSSQERDMVKTIAELAGVRQRSMVFLMREAFNRGLAKLKQKVLTQQCDPEKWTQLEAMVCVIKEKLGFSDNQLRGLMNRSSKDQTSRQVPVGTAVIVSRSDDKLARGLSAEVVDNNELEICIRCVEPPLCNPGDAWIIQFQNGAVTWDFQAITVNVSERELRLSHSDHLRFVSKRHFARVTTEKPAQIAVFPVFKQTHSDSKQIKMEFNSAELIEIAGPNLRLKTSVNVGIRQRVIVLFELDAGLIMQDVGEVRDIQQSEKDRSILIEMIGLSNRDIDELDRKINQIASLGSGGGVSDASLNAPDAKEVHTNV